MSWPEKAAHAAIAAVTLARPAAGRVPLTLAQERAAAAVVEAYELELEDDLVIHCGGAVVDALARTFQIARAAEVRELARREQLAIWRAAKLRRRLRGLVSCRLFLEDGATCPALLAAEKAGLHAWHVHRRAIPVEDLRLHFEELVATPQRSADVGHKAGQRRRSPSAEPAVSVVRRAARLTSGFIEVETVDAYTREQWISCFGVVGR